MHETKNKITSNPNTKLSLAVTHVRSIQIRIFCIKWINKMVGNFMPLYPKRAGRTALWNQIGLESDEIKKIYFFFQNAVIVSFLINRQHIYNYLWAACVNTWQYQKHTGCYDNCRTSIHKSTKFNMLFCKFLADNDVQHTFIGVVSLVLWRNACFLFWFVFCF